MAEVLTTEGDPVSRGIDSYRADLAVRDGQAVDQIAVRHLQDEEGAGAERGDEDFGLGMIVGVGELGSLRVLGKVIFQKVSGGAFVKEICRSWVFFGGLLRHPLLLFVSVVLGQIIFLGIVLGGRLFLLLPAAPNFFRTVPFLQVAGLCRAFPDGEVPVTTSGVAQQGVGVEENGHDLVSMTAQRVDGEVVELLEGKESGAHVFASDGDDTGAGGPRNCGGVVVGTW